MVELDELSIDSLYQELKRIENKKWKQENKSFNSKEWQEECEKLFQLAQKEIDQNPTLNIDKYIKKYQLVK